MHMLATFFQSRHSQVLSVSFQEVRPGSRPLDTLGIWKSGLFFCLLGGNS